jgi:hypothetical protein
MNTNIVCEQKHSDLTIATVNHYAAQFKVAKNDFEEFRNDFLKNSEDNQDVPLILKFEREIRK